jgi:hypothetical protein
MAGQVGMAVVYAAATAVAAASVGEFVCALKAALERLLRLLFAPIGCMLG